MRLLSGAGVCRLAARRACQRQAWKDCKTGRSNTAEGVLRAKASRATAEEEPVVSYSISRR